MNRKIIFINGSAHEFGCTRRAMDEVASELKKHNVDSEFVWLGTEPYRDCVGCNACGKLGRCVYDDDAVNRVLEKIDGADGIVVGSPIYYAGPSGRVCSFLDRLFYAGGRKMKGKIGAAVVNARRAGTTAGLQRLELFFTISGMVIPGSAYWNETHGRTVEDVEQDLEGLHTMRSLGVNIANLIDKSEAAEKAGVPAAPNFEPKQVTDFIR